VPVATAEDGKRAAATTGITMDVNGLELRARNVYSGEQFVGISSRVFGHELSRIRPRVWVGVYCLATCSLTPLI